MQWNDYTLVPLRQNSFVLPDKSEDAM